jgi:hypothetical protein
MQTSDSTISNNGCSTPLTKGRRFLTRCYGMPGMGRVTRERIILLRTQVFREDKLWLCYLILNNH